MTDRTFDVDTTSRVPLKMWTRGVPVEESAAQQLRNVAALPFVGPHVAVMPDVHWGMGATVGSVIPTVGAIVPAAVGVDIGCVDADTEYLSPTGWRRIADYDGGLVMQYDPRTGCGAFVAPIAFIRAPCDEFLSFRTKYGIDQMLSAEHRILCWRIKGRSRTRSPEVISAADLAAEHGRLVLGAKVEIETTFVPVLNNAIALTEAQIRAQVMFLADGHLYRGGSGVLRFKKQRKIERARKLLKKAAIEFTEQTRCDDGATLISMRPPVSSKSIAPFWSASLEQLRFISDECLHWDGNQADRCFFTRNKETADFIQYAFCATGSRAVMRADTAKDGGVDYRVFAHANTKVGLAGSPKSRVTKVRAPGSLKYCFTVPHGFWVMRRGGNIAMTGNCGMMAVRTSLTASDLPDNLAGVRSAIEAAVPHGRTNDGGAGDRGAWHDIQPANAEAYIEIGPGLEELAGRHPRIRRAADRAVHHLGTLGTGNHFIEVCLDKADVVWIMLHSGSRGIGNRIGTYFIELAKQDMRRWFINLPDQDLAYLPEGSEHFGEYIKAVRWAQNFARENREAMMRATVGAVTKALGRSFGLEETAVNCHHNYVAKERHFGKDVWLTRKGAVSAREGELGIIPGSMGARSYIVRGKGNRDSFMSCSHGAGRAMSRTDAKKRFTLEDHAAATAGVECRKDDGVLDETPGAYKSIDQVMAAQTDLVDVVAELRQVVCVKG